MTSFIMSSQAVWLEAIERRIEATTAMLGSMKGVKMCGLTDTLMTNIHRLRVEELKISKKFRRLLVWNLAFGTQFTIQSYHYESFLTLRYSLFHSNNWTCCHVCGLFCSRAQRQ